MKKIAISFAALAMLAVAQSATAGAADLISFSQRIGCGTVVSSRKSTQIPLYTVEYERSTSGATNAAELGQITYGLGLLGLVGSVVASAVAGEVIDATKAPPVRKVDKVPVDGWSRVVAVGIQMDDGKVLNVPLLKAERFVMGNHFNVGDRLSIFYSKATDNIVVAPNTGTSPNPGEPKYDIWCKPRAEQTIIDAVMSADANLVDETKIIQD